MTPTTLAELLELERLDRDLFRGENEPGARERFALYGGQVAAQALRAAGMTVAVERIPHSFHGYFLRPGRVDLPVIFEVDRDRDGGSFSARHVRAVQEGEVIFSMLASFHAHRESPTLDALTSAEAPDPERLPPRPTVASLVEVREITRTRIVGRQIRHPDRIWVRASAPLPDDALAHACALAYASDLGSGFGQTELPGLPTGGPSIDHAVWFHAPIRADEWMLLELRPRKARSSRGVYDGSLRNVQGELGALVAQEMLLRDPVLDDESLRRVGDFLGVVPED